MKNKENYPFDFSFIEKRLSEAESFLKKKKPHKGGFVGIEILNGLFPEGDAENLFPKIAFGDKLSVNRDDSVKVISPLEVRMPDGTVVGYLSFPTSVLLTSLSERGVESFCFVEAKEDVSGIYSIAVSVWCENY